MSTIASILPPPTRTDRPAPPRDRDTETFTLPDNKGQRRADTPTQTQPDKPADLAANEPIPDNPAAKTETSDNTESRQPADTPIDTTQPPVAAPQAQTPASAQTQILQAAAKQTLSITPSDANTQAQSTTTQQTNAANTQPLQALDTAAAIASEHAQQQSAQPQQAAQTQAATQIQPPTPLNNQTPITNTAATNTTAVAPTASQQQTSAEGEANPDSDSEGRFRSFTDPRTTDRATHRADNDTPQPAAKPIHLADQLLKKLADAAPAPKALESAAPQRLGAEPEPDGVNAARLARGLRSAVNQQGGNVTLRLTPPELGTVRIQMELRGTTVSATFHAETDAGRQVLTQDISRLRAGLEAQGLAVDRLSVQGMSQSASANTSDDPLNQRDARDPGQQQHSQNRARDNQQQQGGDTPDSFDQLFKRPESTTLASRSL